MDSLPLKSELLKAAAGVNVNSAVGVRMTTPSAVDFTSITECAGFGPDEAEGDFALWQPKAKNNAQEARMDPIM